MTPEQREEIEKACREVGFYDSHLPRACEDEIRLLVQFARQQISLRVDGDNLKRLLQDEVYRRQKMDIIVDGQKLMESIINANLVRPQCAMDENHPIINVWEANAEEQLEALVLECLTTTPEEKE